MRTRRIRLALAAAVLVCLGVAGAVAAASFTETTSSGFSVATDRIFPGTRSSTAWSVVDAADASAADVTFSTAIGEGGYFTTTDFTSAYASNRYLEFTFQGPLPGGLAVTNAKFNFDFADDTSGQTGCYYIELYTASTSTLLATYGSSSSDVACVTGTSITHTERALTAVTTTDIANDLKVRVYGKESGNDRYRIDMVSITGSSYGSFTLLPKTVGDQADTSMATTTWGLTTAGDGATVVSTNWSSSYSASRYMTFTFPDLAPADAVVSDASFTLSYRAGSSGSNSCWYFEVYSSSNALLSTHGSTSSNISCNSSNSTYQTDTVTLSGIDEGADLNSLTVKVYFKSSDSRAVRFDQVALNAEYELGTGTGCASSGMQTLEAVRDTYVRQDSAGSSYGSASTAFVQSQSSSRNRRMLVFFFLPPTPSGCTVTAATLRVFAQSAAGSRTIQALQVAATWAEATATWTNQPATTGSPATSTSVAGYGSWDVTTQVQAMLAGTNYGFLLRDATESSATSFAQTYRTTESITNIPQLDVTFG